MFEFKMSYLESGYHIKPDDTPFTFPPNNIPSIIESNLVEIQGKNGTGKTTLLNVLALALGYLNEEKELETKPLLKGKLEDLNKNPSLEYMFRICYSKPEPLELLIQRQKGQEPTRKLNAKPISSEMLSSKFDVVFLTEDDPSKVVSSSRDKLAGYFSNIDKRLFTFQGALNKHLLNIVEFRDLESKEKGLRIEIEEHQKNVDKGKIELIELGKLLENVELKQSIKQKLDLLRDESRISRKYQELREVYERLNGKEDQDLLRKIERERREIMRTEGEIKEFNVNILQAVSALGTYGIILDSGRLLNNDCVEFNRLLDKIRPEKQDQTHVLRLVDDFIKVLQQHNDDTLVPLVDKPVNETLKDLYKLKVKLSSDRVLTLSKMLSKILDQKKLACIALEKTNEKIAGLQDKRRDLEGFKKIENDFLEAQKQYSLLQAVLAEDNRKILDQWNKLRAVEGEPEGLRSRIKELDIRIGTEENLRNRYRDNLKSLLENSNGKPKFDEKEQELRKLIENVSKIRENIQQWTQILSRPLETRKEFETAKYQSGFGINEYRKFVKAVGEYLGEQFEPILYDNKFQKIKFFDIEKDTFVTDSDRQIPIDKLSQGQSKMASLTGVFKKMDPNKKKIVLIDEIADLDPENLETVKSTLRDRFNDGSVALSVLVRPSQNVHQPLLITSWG